jgi:hypothetical protein
MIPGLAFFAQPEFPGDDRTWQAASLPTRQAGRGAGGAQGLPVNAAQVEMRPGAEAGATPTVGPSRLDPKVCLLEMGVVQ